MLARMRPIRRRGVVARGWPRVYADALRAYHVSDADLSVGGYPRSGSDGTRRRHHHAERSRRQRAVLDEHAPELRARRMRPEASVTVEHGIVVGGRVIPGTERVIRDSRAWWTEGRETRPRAGATIDMLIGTGPRARTHRAGRGREPVPRDGGRLNAHGEDLS